MDRYVEIALCTSGHRPLWVAPLRWLRIEKKLFGANNSQQYIILFALLHAVYIPEPLNVYSRAKCIADRYWPGPSFNITKPRLSVHLYRFLVTLVTMSSHSPCIQFMVIRAYCVRWLVGWAALEWHKTRWMHPRRRWATLIKYGWKFDAAIINYSFAHFHGTGRNGQRCIFTSGRKCCYFKFGHIPSYFVYFHIFIN